MNGRFEEKLAQLAFGDLSPEDAARIEADAARDPEAARALLEFREMRHGLKALAEVPEDQMSKERLRQAILSSGLRDRQEDVAPSRRFRFGWAWMPVAACALGFGLVVLRTPNLPGNPTVVLDSNSVAGFDTALKEPALKGMSGSSTLSVEVPESASLQSPSQGTALVFEATQPAPATRVASVPSNPNRKRSSRPKQTQSDRVFWSPLPESKSTVVVRNETSSRSNGAEFASNPTVQTAPIVLIDSDQDHMTGANGATEVGTNNVLIGG